MARELLFIKPESAEAAPNLKMLADKEDRSVCIVIVASQYTDWGYIQGGASKL